MKRSIQTELGTEFLCVRCLDYWPASAEFWIYTMIAGTNFARRHSYCRMCYGEYRNEYNAARRAA